MAAPVPAFLVVDGHAEYHVKQLRDEIEAAGFTVARDVRLPLTQPQVCADPSPPPRLLPRAACVCFVACERRMWDGPRAAASPPWR